MCLHSFPDVVINTEIVQSMKLNNHGEKKTFIGRIAVTTKHHNIIIAPEAVLYDTKIYSWKHDMEKHFGGNDFTVKRHSHRIILRYSKTRVKRPLSKSQKNGFQDQLSLKAGQKYCRMLQEEHFAILLTFIKLPFVIKIFVLSVFEWPL